MSDTDRTREKIAKLLRLGMDSSASQGEIDNAMRMAASLMAKHQLTRDDIDLSAVDPVEKMKMGRFYAFFKGDKSTVWEDELSAFVSRFVGTVKYYTAKDIPLRRDGIQLVDAAGRPRTGQIVAFYGPVDDCECAYKLFEELRDAISTMAILRYADFANDDGRMYCFGFVNGLEEQLKDAIENLCTTDSTTTSLILRNQQTAIIIKEKALAWLSETHGITLKKTRGRKIRGSASAHAEGLRDGRSYDAKRPDIHRKLGA